MLLFGEVFTVLESMDHWHMVQSRHDHYEGWIYSRVLHLVDSGFLHKYDTETPVYCGEMLSSAQNGTKSYYLGFGSRIPLFDGRHFYLGNEEIPYNRATISPKSKKDGSAIIDIAKRYLNTPYLWGGRSLLGIDCSGFTQMVFGLCGSSLPRDASQQAEGGKEIESLINTHPGDLAFFSENGQRVTHVGILTGDGHIIHASDEVRIDRIDENGIFNTDLKSYTLQATLIKRYL
jgi:cell wall-associated NlpC family hydrolase